MTRDEQVRMAEANLALLRGTIYGALAKSDLTAGGAMAPTHVEEIEVDDEGNYVGGVIVIRNGVRYRVSIDYA